MKKFLLNIGAFFAVIWAIDWGVGLVGDYLQHHAKGGEERRFNDLVMNDVHDVLILGSSRARHHYDTPFLSDTLGMDVYNAGYDGNGVVLALGILKMVLNRYRPKFVIFDVEPFFDIYIYDDHNHTQYISNLRPYFREPGILDIFRDVSMEEWLKVHSGMVRYNMRIGSLLMNYKSSQEIDNYGFDPYIGVFVEESGMKQLPELEVDLFKITYVEKLVKLCTSNDIPLIMVASPKYKMGDSSLFEPIVDICAKYEIPFIDYYADNDFINHSDWFNDQYHLNNVGARFFSRRLVDDIFRTLSIN